LLHQPKDLAKTARPACMAGIKRSALATVSREIGAAAGDLDPARQEPVAPTASAQNDQAATFLCARFLDLVESTAWAMAAKPVVSANGYRTVAGEFLALVERLADEPAAAQSPGAAALGPWVYLAAQTLECTLKAYIAKLGLKPPVRRQGLDLINLWTTAVRASAGATRKLSLDPTPPDWCAMLSVFHDYPYLDRYPGEHGLALKTERAQLARRLRAILTEVEAAFQ
jgi:hypothetical protein